MHEKEIMEFMQKVKKKLQDLIPVATGKMRKSIHYLVKESEAKLYGHKYLLAVETGRGKYKGGAERGLKEALGEWMNAVSYRGHYTPSEMAYYINKYGTLVPKGREGLISKFDYSAEAKELQDKVGKNELWQWIRILDSKFKTK